MVRLFSLKEVTYKDILHIDELEIPAEQTTALVGESGSGKTTLLKLLNHIVSCDGGDIHFNGKPVNEMNAVEMRRQAVMLTQSAPIFADTVKENLLAGLEFSEQPPVEDTELQKTLETVNLHKGLDEDAEQLSGGELQRLALARIMLMDPPVFLLDEPTSALDKDMEQLVMERFFDYAKAGNKTVVMVTHAREMAKRFADQLIDIEQFSGKAEKS